MELEKLLRAQNCRIASVENKNKNIFGVWILLPSNVSTVENTELQLREREKKKKSYCGKISHQEILRTAGLQNNRGVKSRVQSGEVRGGGGERRVTGGGR